MVGLFFGIPSLVLGLFVAWLFYKAMGTPDTLQVSDNTTWSKSGLILHFSGILLGWGVYWMVTNSQSDVWFLEIGGLIYGTLIYLSSFVAASVMLYMASCYERKKLLCRLLGATLAIAACLIAGFITR